MKPTKNEYARKDISYFLKQFNTKGLSKLEITAIQTVIKQLWQEVGEHWLPQSCHNIPPETDLANRILQESMYEDLFGQIKAKTYLHGHYFWALELKKGKTVILDPTGVPVGKTLCENIIPYFGLISEAKGFHKTVYENMKDDDGWRFHP
jgi:hypothetical protein